MRADNISFRDVFEVDASSGRINLGGNRHILLDAAAVGAMRRELMDNLGWEVTQGIFMRIGYLCGRHDAQQLRKRHSLPSDEETLQAGLRLHYLQGMANARLDHCEINRAAGTLRIAGEWIDSFEADYHLQQYGIGNRSVCWTLEGYCSGFASECLNQEILCLETHCRGKGETACSFKFLPAAEWGDVSRPIQEMLITGRFMEVQYFFTKYSASSGISSTLSRNGGT